MWRNILGLVVLYSISNNYNIQARHTDTQRDYSTCPSGHVPCAIKNNDGFLKLTCFKPRCEEITKVKEICTEAFTSGCPKGFWVGSIHREFKGNNEKPEYKTKCCQHPIFQKTVSIKPMPDFFPGSEAKDAASGQGDYIDIVTNVLGNSQYDHHTVEITSVMCHSSTTTRSTARPTRKPDDRQHGNNNGGVAGGKNNGGKGQENHNNGNPNNNGGGHNGGGSHGGSHENGGHGCGPAGCNNQNPKLEGGHGEHYAKQNAPPPKPVPQSANSDYKAWGIDASPRGAGNGGPGCFTADTLVRTKSSGQKRMDELEVGDEILSSLNWDGQGAVSYQPIRQFIHRDPSVRTRYTVVSTSSGRSISLTPYHLLPQFECARLSEFVDRNEISVRQYELFFAESARFAHRARIGGCVLVLDDESDRFVADRIVNVTSAVRRGVYSPITESGILVANGVQASCYSSVENHALQHAFFSFVRKCSSFWQPYFDYVKNIFSTDSKISIEDDDGQIPTLLRIMLVLSNLVTGSF